MKKTQSLKNALHVLFHIFFNYFVARIVFGLSFQISLVVVIGGLVVDVDHILYGIYLLLVKKYFPERLLKEWKQNLSSHTPSFFIFHTVEFLALFLICGYFISEYIFFLAIGFVLHWLVDCFIYLFVYKSFSPWLDYFSIWQYFRKVK